MTLGKTDPIESNKIQISSDSKCIRELKEIVGKEYYKIYLGLRQLSRFDNSSI